MKTTFLLAAGGLLCLAGCGVYQDYPNDSTAIENHRGNEYGGTYYNRYSGTHPYAHTDHVYVVDNEQGDAVVGQDKDAYMKQNDDKWMYNSCPPGAAKRGDC